MKKTNIDDVAKSLGVSKTLVSLVINNKWKKFGISEATRDRVMKKVAELSFKPNVAARGLRTGKSYVVALIVSDISNQFYSRIAHTVERLARNDDYQLMICSSDEDIEKEMTLVRYFIDSQQADGIILSSSQENSKVYRNIFPKDYPVVFIDRDLKSKQHSSVTVDNVHGAYEAVKLLIDNGSKRPAIFTISPTHISSISDRLEGYKEAIKDGGIRFNKSYIREIPFENIQNSVRKNLKELLVQPHSIDSLFVVNNNIAMACLEYFTEWQVRVPQDLQFISFDDIDVFRFCHPQVSAVAQPIEEMAEKAYSHLMKIINKEGVEPHQIVLKTTMVLRKSCGSVFK